MSKQAIVTGGSGFVGGHLIRHLLTSNYFETIINVDYQPPAVQLTDDPRLHFRQADIRKALEPGKFKDLGCGRHTVIFNLAAICKIPGYPKIDYFRTNIRGAETVCALAEVINAKSIVFTSSIAPYGASEAVKTEKSIPQPDNAYGSSKLVAEHIHRGWQQKKDDERNLTILRPGIIFGKHEQANFTRLYDSMKKGYFVYPGRKDTRKACVYVKDVARACGYFAEHSRGLDIFNLVYPQPPNIQEICASIAKHTDAHRPRFTVPGGVLKMAARGIQITGKVTGKKWGGIHPDRVEKVMISTRVSGQKLAESSFELKYSLEEGIKEWYEECGQSLY